MFKQIIRRIQQYSTGRSILILFVTTVALAVLINASTLPFSARMITEQSGGLMLLDMHFSYTPNDAYKLLEALGKAGRQAYLTMHLTLDLVFPVVYSLLFSFSIAWFLKRLLPPDHFLQWIVLIPFIAGLADLIENVNITIMGLTYPTRLDGLVRLSSLMTTLKFGLMPLGVLCILICAILLAIRRKS